MKKISNFIRTVEAKLAAHFTIAMWDMQELAETAQRTQHAH